MPVERFYANSELKEKQLINLEDQEFNHLIRVMRAKVGQNVELVNGKGALAVASIDQISKRQASLKVIQVQSLVKEPYEIILAQAIPRINRLDFIVEKGTELGMTKLWLFPGKNSERKQLTEHQLDRLRHISIAAMKQCGRLFLPEICLQPPLEAWSSLPSASFFGDIEPEAPPFGDDWTLGETIAFFIGPEAGFTDGELIFLKNKGAKGVKLHPNILRTDTAALVALSLINYNLLERE